MLSANHLKMLRIEARGYEIISDAEDLIAAGFNTRQGRVIQQSDRKAWLSLPQCKYTKDGQKKYSALVELSDSLKRELSRVVLAAWEAQQ
jgi:hypothetical protein